MTCSTKTGRKHQEEPCRYSKSPPKILNNGLNSRKPRPQSAKSMKISVFSVFSSPGTQHTSKKVQRGTLLSIRKWLQSGRGHLILLTFSSSELTVGGKSRVVFISLSPSSALEPFQNNVSGHVRLTAECSENKQTPVQKTWLTKDFPCVRFIIGTV